jgi:radical SAM superfamily enzyme YgiQ (UPF0313 family)
MCDATTMKILLILPAGDRVRVTRANPHVPKRAMLRFSVLPLTMVAALTPREYEVRVVDENVEPLDFDAECDLAGITFMTALAPRAYEIAREFRARGKIAVGGGYHATLCPIEAAEHFDAIVAGDAEGAWERVLADVETGRLRWGGDSVGCRVFRDGGQAVFPESAAAPGRIYRSRNNSPVLRVPIPRRELLVSTAKHYVTVNAVQTGRGCPHACRYCSVTMFHNHKYRHRPLAQVLEELRQIPRDFIFVDDNIIADRAYAHELFTAMVPLRKRWVSQCSIDIADDAELLWLAHEAGCCGLFIGIETTSAENLAAIGKQFNQSGRYAQRLAAIRRMGIGIVAGIIVGMDGDDVRVFERTLHFLEETRIDALQLNILTPLPGTPLFDDLERAGRMTNYNWSLYDYRHVVFRPAQMTAEELRAGADWLYAQFYRLDRILWRFARGLFTVGWKPAFLGLKLGLTYRYDNRRESIVGLNPAKCARDRESRVYKFQPARALAARNWIDCWSHSVQNKS